MTESIILEAIKEPISSVLKTISKEFRQAFRNRILEYEVSEYKRNSKSKTIINRYKPRPLNEFYQPLSIKYQDGKKEIRLNTESPEKLFSHTNFITIIGTAGSGKSTIIKHLFTESIHSGFKVPIKIELRYFDGENNDLLNYIYDNIFKFNSIGFEDYIITKILDKGEFVFFFDGLDEIPTSLRSTILRQIDSFVSRFCNNSYLITSRPHANIEFLPRFTNFLVCDLNSKEIEAFIKKQYDKTEAESANKIINAVKSNESNSYKTFLSNPLLLSMFILTYQRYSDVPPFRSEFYRQVFDTLYSMYDSLSKPGFVRERESGLNQKQYLEVLRLFSFLSFFEEKYRFSSSYLNDKLDIIKDKRRDLIFENDKLINDLVLSISIIYKDGIEYLFPHRSLQEYFTATYVANLSNNIKEVFYMKKYQDVINEKLQIENYIHFLKILYEIDKVAITKYFTIPILKYYHKKTVDIFKISPKKDKLFININIFRLYICIDVIFNNIVTSNKIVEPFQEKIISYNNLHLGGTSKSTTSFIIDEILASFHKYGKQYIDTINDDINKIDESDSDIINLLQ